MKLPDWDMNLQAWDMWNAFHINVSSNGLARSSHYTANPFVMFDTGELVATSVTANINSRLFYPCLDLRVVSTSDHDCPQLYMPDGEPVTKAWLDHNGAQYLLIDRGTKRAVSLGNVDVDELPERFVRTAAGDTTKRSSRVNAYFPGPDRNPVGGKIAITRPLRKALSAPHYEWVQMIKDTCTAGAKMTRDVPAKGWRTDRPLPVERVLEVGNWTELTDVEQNRLINVGAQSVTWFPYLLTEKPA